MMDVFLAAVALSGGYGPEASPPLFPYDSSPPTLRLSAKRIFTFIGKTGSRPDPPFYPTFREAPHLSEPSGCMISQYSGAHSRGLCPPAFPRPPSALRGSRLMSPKSGVSFPSSAYLGKRGQFELPPYGITLRKFAFIPFFSCSPPFLRHPPSTEAGLQLDSHLFSLPFDRSPSFGRSSL